MRTLRVIALLVFVLSLSVTAYGQATRTWVSGVGDDANPCSRTAPCKTFAGAISKTAPGGEISVLDPGGFGALTITKSITIEGDGFVASVLASGTNGINISAATTDHVQLRNLQINGGGTGVNGINILQAGQVIIENCTIFDFNSGGTSRGIRIANSGVVTRVAISNTSIRNVSGIGIASEPTGGGFVFLSLDNVRISGVSGSGLNGLGSAIDLGNATNASVDNCVLAENSNAGLIASQSSVEATVNRTSIFRNGTGIAVGDLGGGTVRLFECSINMNGNGIQISSGTVATHGNNAIAGNGGSQATNSTIGQQ